MSGHNVWTQCLDTISGHNIWTQWGNVAMHSTVQYSTVQYSIVQYSTVQYSTVQYSTVQEDGVRGWLTPYSTLCGASVLLRNLDLQHGSNLKNVTEGREGGEGGPARVWGFDLDYLPYITVTLLSIVLNYFMKYLV